MTQNGLRPVGDRVLVYTRKPQGPYTDALSNSIHLALSEGGGPFEPLNRNYGILFAEATLSPRDTIQEKGLKNPSLFRTADGGFGLLALRTTPLGADDEEGRGCVLLWTSPDLTTFTSHGLQRLHDSVHVLEATCRYDDASGSYAFHWRDADGNTYANDVVNLAAGETTAPRPAPELPDVTVDHRLEGVRAGNALAVEPPVAQALRARWTPLTHTATTVPQSVVASSPEDLEQVRATAVYSDGSTHEKQVVWDTAAVDWSVPGTYRVPGKVHTPTHPFPLARGFADPVILPWEGRYYFIATNDNENDIGLYLRESETIEGLFSERYRESVILDLDEERGLVQTFWAPEFHLIGGDLYILFAVSSAAWGPQCHLMRLKPGHDLMQAQSWDDPVRVRRADGSFLGDADRAVITLDMTWFKADGRCFVLWSSRSGINSETDTGSMVHIAETTEDDPAQLISEPVLLTRPLYGWENLHGTINNEGPYALVTDDAVYVAYSAGSARGYTYSIGMLTIPRGSDYLDAASWAKAPTPAVSYVSIDGLYGAGHSSFFTDFDGNTWICYHAVDTPVGNDVVSSAMHRVHLGAAGAPVLDLDAGRDLRADLADVLVDVVVRA